MVALRKSHIRGWSRWRCSDRPTDQWILPRLDRMFLPVWDWTILHQVRFKLMKCKWSTWPIFIFLEFQHDAKIDQICYSGRQGIRQVRYRFSLTKRTKVKSCQPRTPLLTTLPQSLVFMMHFCAEFWFCLCSDSIWIRGIQFWKYFKRNYCNEEVSDSIVLEVIWGQKKKNQE